MRPQRTLVVMAAFTALLLTMLAESTVALPVQGNLVVTSGDVLTVRSAALLSFGTYVGDGFSLRLASGVSSGNGGRSTPDAYTLLPGTVVTPFDIGMDVDWTSSATILGVNYGGFCEGCISTAFFSANLPEGPPGSLTFRFTESLTLPPVTPGPLEFTAPFTFTAGVGINTFGFNEPLFNLTLRGEGMGTVRFLPGVDGWRFDGSFGGTRYVFGEVAQPTPEPATLLLWGTAAAGLGVARRIRRRRSG